MAISHSEQTTLTCPACHAQFVTDVWLVIDAGEHPELVQALRDGVFDQHGCPHCGAAVTAHAPLLLHDAVARRVYFAAPPDTEEFRWREQAQELLYLLMEALPEQEHLPYLGNVQVEGEVEGLRRALLRRERRRGGQGQPKLQVGIPIVPPEPAAAPPETPAVLPTANVPPVMAAVRELLEADSATTFAAIVAAHPLLATPAADLALAQLADVAYNEGQRDMAEAMRVARVRLADLLAGSDMDAPPATSPESAEPAPAQRLPDAACQALLRAASNSDLLDATRDFPALLEPWGDEDLLARADAALDEGNERLASLIEERRELLAELRHEMTGASALGRAIQALLGASGEDALAQTLTDHPILLAEVAQQALGATAETARAAGDSARAEQALSFQAMLREVRAGLEGG